jgi:hypothetical protein
MYLFIYVFCCYLVLNFELKLFQETTSGTGAGAGSLDFLRNNPQVGFCFIYNTLSVEEFMFNTPILEDKLVVFELAIPMVGI